MWIAYSPCVDGAADAVAELSPLARTLLADLEQYAIRAEPSWRPDVFTVSTPRAGIEVAYVDRYGVTCPIVLFQVCPPEEGPDGPEGQWWLRAILYPTGGDGSLHRMLVRSVAGWLRRRPYVVNS